MERPLEGLWSLTVDVPHLRRNHEQVSQRTPVLANNTTLSHTEHCHACRQMSASGEHASKESLGLLAALRRGGPHPGMMSVAT